MSACLYFCVNLIGYCIYFEGKHELLGIVVGLAGKRHIFYAHFVCTSLNSGTFCHDSKLFVHRINHRFDIILLKLDDGVKCGNRAVVVLTRTLYGCRVVYGFPVCHNITHVAFTAHHLPGIGQFAAHNLL